MIDVINDPIGTKYGCKYSYTGTNAVGTFSDLTSVVTDGRCVKDPTTILGYNFEGKNIPDKNMFTLRSGITINTTRQYKTNVSALKNGTEEVTKELVDFTKYKEVLAFSTIGDVFLTGIPKDQLFVMKEPISTAEYINGIYSITFTVTNAFAKVAIGNGTNYYTFDAENEVWSAVDLTHDTDALKTEMMDYTVLNAITQEQYALQFSDLDKLSIAMLIGIDPASTTTADDGTVTNTYDTTKKYTIDSIVVNYVGDDTTGPTNQYFNFVKVGYSPKGNPILIADRPIQENISFSTLYTAKMVYGDTELIVKDSEISYKIYPRLPISAIDFEEDEWKYFITEGYLPSGKTTEEYYNTEIPSITSTIATKIDDDGNSSGTNAKLICRGGLEPGNSYNVANTTTSADVGWRPVFDIDLSSAVAARPNTVLDEVTSIKDLAIGKCISCDHIYSASGIGTFKNLGKATLGLLSDYTNKEDGSFFFNCVGFDKDGNPICVADRPVATGMNYYTLANGNAPDITGYYGKEVEISNCKYTIRHMFTNSGNEFDDDNEYAKFMTTLGTDKKFDDIWHTDKTLTITNTILDSETKENMIIVKGLTDSTRTSKKQRFIPYNTTSALELNKLAFRPLIILKPQTHVETLDITPYVGQDGNDKQNQFKVKLIILDNFNKVKEYKLSVKDTVIKDYSSDEEFILSTDNFELGSTTIDIIIKQIDETTKEEKEVVIKSFEVYKDAKRRTTTFRKFGENYSGWDTEGAVDYHQSSTSTAKSFKQTVKNGTSIGYIYVSRFTTKVTFN